MPDSPLPPKPDALRGPRPAPASPKIDILHDPFNPDPAALPPDAKLELPAEETERPATGLAEYDAPHAFASVLATGFGRTAIYILTCMLAFGITSACHRVSLIPQGWREGGFGGFLSAIIAVPGSLLMAPGEWFTSLGNGILEPLGAPYLLLLIGGLILAVRSEIHLVRLMVFYALLGGLHAAAYLKMRNPLSLLLWLGAMAGIVWLYRWYWAQQMQVEDFGREEEKS